MYPAVQRKRFFSSSTSSDSEMSLPSAATAGKERLTPTRSKSLEDRLFSIKTSKRANRRSMPTIETSQHDGYSIDVAQPYMAPPYRATSQSLPNPGTTVASVTGCLILALLGALVFQRQTSLDLLLDVKHEIAHHLHQLQELRELPPYTQGIVSMHGDLDSDKQLYYMEQQRLRTRQSIRLLSKRLLREKYGLGPKYYVEMQLVFDPESNVYDEDEDHEPSIVVIETARIDQMPHSVFHFLELVSHHAYDGTIFHRRANHIVQAGPSAVPSEARVFDPSLSSIMFQEYSPEMAHTPYTLGFPGRPGGPDFYINIKDNSKLHGPGGQSWHYGDVLDDADPCFGAIVRGVDVIDKIHQSEVDQSGYRDTIAHPILIKKMTVLGDNLDALTSSSPLRGRR
ncbi:PPIases accelerate the folding of proteins (By similarity) [Seminavis robusta]|uniref:PPIases accelerate the folding of proteins By similarity n=1 Tax=Seminavis robusta TaxID=568900 RepID=A0A9N8EIF2_9STRA|nr:PPIases accelerate the folding of proteins (By similarity) [Seminavis robusta]|eukprot:Sro1041_g234610.1 PPIases accelerate the folding of proteins (By similarity) (397) ;mRNA; f:29989-31257